ncbi:hypothetical protein A2X44_04610 [candidate division CPR3 bacterium GWF2_35_18]|uniref:Peptidase E n=1 Tax=candidate division CPR3 bacterium GW2011_GWF2_35_18 TaxID=1618350 RepID=A0A0G0C0T3_UNCC3|nr:MAG: Peptidase E [candidate division CPR3 bacterium GW2011_GWF2_35_18]OGB63616.1 MAG: hypothetical protein A2X44_04610 [candidate division CPR3 bacterium GWF2_35_18]OGB64189.1 MAG: hypothetical protein A2250_02635 [candidate division CPR3 bacterium RIFOXYA2_FULL_35_13]OGB76813.1 MAG: hypothetical protein A2476_05020 [candidate division CPR3 bacterium RIFOXYC2_FULL_35_7]OGB78392.1 MAG: hypothetical protein A2296_02830 [candidate division CPR3 bacterium RIFOXYB2_FULL_35_8]
MKMYLSSYRLGNEPEKLVRMIGVNKKIAVIPNALDFSTDILRRNEGVQREIDDLNKLGLQAEELDLKKYFNKPKELEHKLSEFGALWIRGGNTFVLRKAFKESGLDEWLKKQKDNKELVYAGYSAGVCILSSTLKGLEIVDDPVITAEGYSKETLWDGLGLIDFAFAPHFESPGHPETEAVGREVMYYKREGIKFKALHDGEVLVIEE